MPIPFGVGIYGYLTQNKCVEIRKGDVMTGKIIMYSLNSGINLTLEDMDEKAETFGVPLSLLPLDEKIKIAHVRTMLRKTFSLCFAVTVRKNGGVVFIPQNCLQLWGAVKQLFMSMGIIKDVVEFTLSEVDIGIVSLKFKEELKDFFEKEVPLFKDENGYFRLPHIRIDMMNCTKFRIEYMLKKIELYSRLGADLTMQKGKIESLYNAIQRAIEIRTEEIEEEKLYGY